MEPTSDNLEKTDWPLLLGLGLVGLVLFFYQLGAAYLMDPDEGRYAEIAREMLALQDWLIPRLNLLPYLEKPPLVYWLTAVSFKFFGFTAAAARLPVAVSALAGLFLTYWLGRVLWGPLVGILGALVLATSVGYIILGRILTLDMTFGFLLNLAIGLGYLALSRKRPRLWPWAYLALALAVLTKGPVAVVLAGLVWVICILFMEVDSPSPSPSSTKGERVKRGLSFKFSLKYAKRPWKSLFQPWGWLLLALITVPWLVYVQWRYPEFFHFFILEQHLLRFLTPAIHPEPVYYYVPVLLGLLLPWTWLLAWAVVNSSPWRDPDERFMLIWAGVIVVFFSLSRGKLAPYILPALLPLALLFGRGLAQLSGPGRLSFNNRILKTSLIVWGITGVALVALNLWPPEPLAKALARADLTSPYVLIVCLVWALTPLAALLWRHLGALLLGALLLGALLPLGIDQVSRGRSFRNLGLALKSEWRPGAALVGVQLYSQGLSFYSGQIFHLLGCRTELDFGVRLSPGKDFCLPDRAALPAFTAGHSATFFFVKADDLSWLAEGLPGKFRRLASHRDCVLLAYEGK